MKRILVAIAVVSLGACGGGGGAAGPVDKHVNTPPPSGGISVTNNSFSPGSKSIAVGATVNWSWNSCTGDPYGTSTCVEHSVTFDDGITSPLQDQGTFNRTFAAAGTYNYHCSVHGTAMSGSITVQ